GTNVPNSHPSDATVVIGPFRIVRTLGEGAMGVVYLGERAEQFSQRVAIKMLHPQVSLLFGENALRHEEKVLTSLDHPAIVRLLDTGEHAGLRYIVMEYVEGLPLDTFCRKHALTTDQRILLLIEILRAVDYAHRHLVIHADLKPANILISPERRPKILDFGVAVLVGPGGNDTTNSHAIFTPAFASPEQLANDRATAASDIYSMGSIAKLLLSGNGARPHRWSSDIDAILETATRVEPDRRYSSAKQFADDLQAVLDYRPVVARRGSRGYKFGKWIRRRRATATVVFALAIILIGSALGVVVESARTAHQRRVAQARLYDLVRLTGTLEGELYDSAHSLPHGQNASASLLQAATKTLDTLAKQNGNDSTLALEVSRQYGKLATLEEAQGSQHDAALDIEKGLGLLRTIPSTDRNYGASLTAQKDLAELSHP
ncbi:MAG: serine/threonine-protein kinase, partial [Bryocella sp.]